MAVATYTHRALFHDTDDELVAGLVPFVTEGIEAGERVVVVVAAAVGEMLRDGLGSSDDFDLWDSIDVYTQPVRTLAAYVETVRAGTEGGRSMRVAGQPIWAGLSPLETTEWTCVEAACNEVFAESRLQMLCPYDTSKLDQSVIAAARRTHPEIRRGSHLTASSEFSPVDHQSGVRASALPPRSPSSEQISIFSSADLAPVLSFVEMFAGAHGMAAGRLAELRVAVDEMVTHSIDYRLAPARLHIWATAEELVCEIESSGSPTSPFAGYLPPSMSTTTDRGLWLAGQQCDLIAVRKLPDLTAVRLHFSDYLVSARPRCDGVDKLLGAYALRACDPDEAALVDAHLATCDDCRAEVERLSHVVGWMNHPDGHDQLDG